MERPAPSLAELLNRTQPGDFGERGTVYIVPLPGDAFMRLSARAVDALRLHAQGQSLDDAAVATANGAEAWNGARVQQIRDQLIARAQSTSRAADSVGFFWRCQLLSARLVRRIVAPLTSLFRPAVAVLVVAVTLVVLALTIAPSETSSVSDVACGYAWMLASLIAHELGHAAAVAAFDAEPGPIGFTVYVIYPAFYSDVSAAWRLRRKERFVVDVGGVYFQLAFIAIVLLARQLWPLPGVHLALLLTLFSVAMTMHPFLKFDGYWMLADALGVANLAKWRTLALRNLLASLRQRPREPLPWRPVTSAIVTVYALSSSVFAAAFIVYLLPRVWYAVLRYPAAVRMFVSAFDKPSVLRSPGPWLALAGSTITIMFAARLVIAMTSRVRAALSRER